MEVCKVWLGHPGCILSNHFSLIRQSEAGKVSPVGSGHDNMECSLIGKTVGDSLGTDSMTNRHRETAMLKSAKSFSNGSRYGSVVVMRAKKRQILVHDDEAWRAGSVQKNQPVCLYVLVSAQSQTGH
jgi:hypothetical protein